MSEHTPGSWEAREDYDSTWWVVQSGPAQDLAIHDLSEADARLIAAAPDLLKALEEFLSSYGSIYRGDMDRAVKLGSAAIAKVEGE